MKYEDIKIFVGENVVLIDDDGKRHEGRITNTVSEFDSLSGKEEIDVECDGFYLGIPIDEIQSIEEKGEKA